MNSAALLYLPPDTEHPPHITELAEQYGVLPVFRQPEEPFFLQWENGKIVLHLSGVKESVCADFENMVQRTQHNSGEMIVRAVRPAQYRQVWDATAGLGRDAFVLASFGANVVLFERHAVPALLLGDALFRAAHNPQTAETVSRMTLHFGTIADVSAHFAAPQVICLDPMFPERRKSALVKKEMRFFQAAVGADTDSAQWLTTARQTAQERIVVKRPLHAPFLGDTSPDFQYTGKSTRFDVYLPTWKTDI